MPVRKSEQWLASHWRSGVAEALSSALQGDPVTRLHSTLVGLTLMLHGVSRCSSEKRPSCSSSKEWNMKRFEISQDILFPLTRSALKRNISHKVSCCVVFYLREERKYWTGPSSITSQVRALRSAWKFTSFWCTALIRNEEPIMGLCNTCLLSTCLKTLPILAPLTQYIMSGYSQRITRLPDSRIIQGRGFGVGGCAGKSGVRGKPDLCCETLSQIKWKRKIITRIVFRL